MDFFNDQKAVVLVGLVNVNKIEVALLIIPSRKTIYPVSAVAFSATQSSMKKLKENIGGIVIWKNGQVKEILSIKKRGLYGKSFFQKVISALFGANYIDVIFKSIDLPFSEIAALVAEYILYDSKGDDPTFEVSESEKLIRNIRSSSNVEEIFRLLAVPGPEDCLDVL